MTRTAKYFIAQHLTDPMRQEAKNVGVFVSIGSERTQRFVGETVPGKIDGRRLSFLPHPNVYRQWVDYWQRTMSASPDPICEIIRASGPNYRVVEGGEVFDIGDDSIHQVASFLFSSLISEDGMAKAVGGEEEEEPSLTPLKNDIRAAFSELSLLMATADGKFRYPIHDDTTIQGESTLHRPTFAQRNGHPTVMEPLDMTGKKPAVRDHAGWAAFMFGDILDRDSTAETISLVRVTAETENIPVTQYAIEMLRSTSRIVKWSVPEERNLFLNERISMAVAISRADVT